MPRVLIVLIPLFLLFGCGDTINQSYVSNNSNSLWAETVSEFLNVELWEDKYAYDAGHSLMVPLHASFYLNQTAWRFEFDRHFRKFLNDDQYILDDSTRLNRLHYLYLASRYLVLSNDRNHNKEFLHELYEKIDADIIEIWTAKAWQWDRKPFDLGMKERIEWKLTNKNPQQSYYRAIIDEELFIFAIASDLSNYCKKNNLSANEHISEIVDIAYAVFQSEGTFLENDRWLFQIGVWDDHPDYLYSAYNSKSEKVYKSKKIIGIAGDTSHGHRFPLWLNSFIEESFDNKERNEFYKKIKKGLAVQFFNKVLIEPDQEITWYRTNNYLDGNNGLYRWDEKKQSGYGPYELSGTLLLGWWTFLDTTEIKQVYEDIYRSFPLNKQAVENYVGPNTERQRHNLVKYPNYFENGFGQLNVYLASKI